MTKELENCFENNAWFFQLEAKPGWHICHGIIINIKDKLPMSHCWIEYSEFVIDASFKGKEIRTEKRLYYEVGNIDPKNVVRYDRASFIEKILEERTYGPWEIECDR